MTDSPSASAPSSSPPAQPSAPAQAAAPAAALAPPAPANPNPNPAAAGAAPAPAAAGTSARPEGIPETYWDAATNTLKVDPVALAKDFTELNGLKAFKAAEDSRKLTIPAPEAYVPELPKDFKAPEGLTFELNKDDPLIAQARVLANKRGLDQEGFSEFLGLYAATKVGEQQQFQAAFQAEVGKLGVNGPARITAINTFLDAVGGKESAALQRVLQLAPVADTVVALENLMKRFSSQGGAGFTQSGRAQEDNQPSAEEFGAWTYNQQREFHSTGKRPQRAA